MERLPLGLVKSGLTAVIRDIRGSEHLKQELLEQGLVDGCRVKVVKNDTSGPLIISVNDTRLALGRGVALQVLVEEADSLKKFSHELGITNLCGTALCKEVGK
ncbi:MAG: FeoA family protein [Dehalococcoides mccartyi]|uniref:FeoA family protein n=1 Tax=Dehalococcoides TaxID=61434 RepID=UPI002737F3E1|nr:FeoA family protein [Dehalococcoides mccartyi]MDP4279367.1 FeoA family protein [Dehalococcoides mccartyi]